MNKRTPHTFTIRLAGVALDESELSGCRLVLRFPPKRREGWPVFKMRLHCSQLSAWLVRMMFRVDGGWGILVCPGPDNTQTARPHPHIRRPRPSLLAQHWCSSKLNKIWAARGDDILAAKQTFGARHRRRKQRRHA